MQALRKSELRKNPGVAETLDWSVALQDLGVKSLKDNLDTIFQTRSCLLKTQDDMSAINKSILGQLLETID